MRGKAGIVVSKNNLLRIALQEASKEKKGIEGLRDFIDGQRALITTDMNPFKLYIELEGTKTKMAAKGGEIAEEEIIVNEGDTGFKPGPVISEFQKAGLPAAIERGKIIIKKETSLVKQGDKISKDVANALTKLEIFPMTVGLDLVGAYEDGLIYTRETLAVDQGAQIELIMTASTNAFNLALNLEYPTIQTLPILISKAHHDAMNLGLSENILSKETIPYILQRAHAQALSLKSKSETK